MVKQRLKDRAAKADQGVAEFMSRTLGIYEPVGTRYQIVNLARTRIRELASSRKLHSQSECSTSEWRSFLTEIVDQEWFSATRQPFIATHWDPTKAAEMKTSTTVWSTLPRKRLGNSATRTSTLRRDVEWMTEVSVY
jgi:hypothetical protein